MLSFPFLYFQDCNKYVTLESFGCYMIEVSNVLFWPEAQTFCEDLGAQVMAPETQDESDALIKAIKPFMEESGRTGVLGMLI